MNKKGLISYLEERLSVLKKSERDDIINEYIQHIDNKLNEGLSEKDAVKTLGSIEDMVKETLSAYNVDPEYDNRQTEKGSVLADIFYKFTSFIQRVGDYILGQQAINLLKLAFTAVILGIVLCVCFFIGNFAAILAADVIASVIGGYTYLKFLAKLIYTIIALPTVIYIFIRCMAINIMGGKEEFEKSKENKENNENAHKQNKLISQKPAFEFKDGLKAEKNRAVMSFSVKKSIDSLWRYIIKVSILVFKACVLMCALILAFIVLFSFICLGGLIVMAFLGYPVIGGAVGALGFCMAGTAFLPVIVRLVFFNRKG